MKRLLFLLATALLAGAPLQLRADGTIADPTNVASTRPDIDEDQDGLTNQEEAEVETFPYNPYSDTDTLMDGEDAVPLLGEMKVHAAPEATYALIHLGSGQALGVNDLGEVLVKEGTQFKVWKNGAYLPAISTPAESMYGPLQDGTVYIQGPEEWIDAPPPGAPDAVNLWRWKKYRWTSAGGVVESPNLFYEYSSEIHAGAFPSNIDRFFLFEVDTGTVEAQFRTSLLLTQQAALPLSPTGEVWSEVGSISSGVFGINDAHGQAIGSGISIDVNYWAESGNGWERNGASIDQTICGLLNETTNSESVTSIFSRLFRSTGELYHEGNPDIIRSTSGGFLFGRRGYSYGPSVGIVKHGASVTVIPRSQSIVDAGAESAPEGPYFVSAATGGSSPYGSAVSLWCLNSGTPAEFPLKKMVIGSGPGLIVGRQISNDLQIPMRDRLWRNGRSLDLKSLVAGGENWATIWADMISPIHGMMPANLTTTGQSHSSACALLLPVQLIDTKDKALDAPGASVPEANRDVTVIPKRYADAKNSKSIAWIEPHGSETTPDGPDMPQLVLRLLGTEQMGLKIKWKLQIIYDRPRGNQPDVARIKSEDEVFVPAKEDGNQPWRESALDGTVEIYDDPAWNAALTAKGFFGGEAQLTYQLIKADGTALSSESTIFFSIGGKNPDDDKSKTFIDSEATAADALLVRLSYAVGRHESKDYNDTSTITGTRYNQFWERSGHRFKNDYRQGDPLWCKSPKEKSAGGFGIFQITGDLSSEFAIIPREQMWNWQKNTDAYISIVKTGGSASKGSVMDRFIAAVARTYTNDAEAQTAPTSYAYEGDNYGAWEMGTITLYNGGPYPARFVKGPSGKMTKFYVPWNYETSRSVGDRWKYYPNGNNYIHEVILER